MLRKLAVLLLALVAVTAQGCIFKSGMEGCDVSKLVIGYGNYALLGPQMTANGPDAAFTSDPAYLVDGKPGTLVNAVWSTGSQTTSSYVAVKVSPSDPNGDTPLPEDVVVVGLLNTSLPVDMVAQLWINNALIATGKFAATNATDATSVWFIIPVESTGGGPVEVRMFNNVAGATVMGAADAFTMGELFVGNGSEWNLKRDIAVSYVTTNRARYSSTGAQFVVLNPTIRQYAMNLSPIPQKETFTNTAPLSFSALMREVFASDVCAFIPFTNFDPSYYGDLTKFVPAIIAPTAMLGQFSQSPTIKGDGDQYYDCSMVAQESV